MKHETQNIFFISDLHLGHKNVLKYDNRPFNDINEMQLSLIKNWNEVVGENDIVYYLGDLSFGNDSLTKWFIHSINGQINFIIGNHDKIKDIEKLGRFNNIYEYGTEIYIKDDDNKASRNSNGYQQIILSHYPLLSWNRSHYGSWHLHGHSHGKIMQTMPEYYNRKVMDVGCNCINYKPISYDEIKKIMINRISTFHH